MTVLLPAAPARASTLPAPTDLHTSPVSACPATTPTIIGNDDVTLYAGMPGSLGPGSYQVTFAVTQTSTSASIANVTESVGAGGTAQILLTQSVLNTAAAGAITEFSWNVKLSNGTDTSPVSQTCSFYFNPNYPGTPTITQTTSSYTLGDPVQFKISPAASGAAPVSYQYAINYGPYRTIAADSSGDATITVTPTSNANTLSVTALSPGGNPSQPASLFFVAASPPPAADGDLTSDGIPDLVVTGGAAGIAPGLWVAPGQAAADGTTGNGQVITPAVDIGAGGSGIGTNSPTDFNGAQVITGGFYGEGLQDYLVYYPVYHPGGPFAGTGIYISGSGHGAFLTGPGGASLGSSTWQFMDPYGDIPLQVANGYNADTSDTPDNGPDLLTVSGDPANGYYLEDYTGFFPGLINSSVPLLSTNAPDGTMDWNNWQISTMQDAAGQVDMFLYDAATNALYLWTNFTIDAASATASYTQYLISSGWNPGTISTLRAADINGDGTPDVWTVSADGVVTSWLVTGLGATPAINARFSAPLLTPTHLWQLNTSGTQGTADYGSGTQLPLSATGNVTWQNDSQFNAATFDGSTAALSTTAPSIDTTGSFSVSAWANPSGLSGTVLSESDTANPALAVWLSNGRWQAGVTFKSSKNPVWTTATAANAYDAKQNTWTHVIVTYDAPTGTLTLYLNGSKAASVTTGTAWNPAAGTFTLGAMLTGGALGKFFAGKITDVQVWDGTALSAAQAAAFTS